MHRLLPDDHLTHDSKEVVKLATGLLATMAAVVLGLLITSAKDSFDRLQEDVLQNASKIILLDQVLAEYGPETQVIREMLRTNTILTVNQRFTDGVKLQAKSGTTETQPQYSDIQSRIRKLTPGSREQNSLVNRAIELSNEISLAHWALYNQDSSISSAIPGDTDILAGHHFRQLRHLRAAQYHGDDEFCSCARWRCRSPSTSSWR